MSTSDSQGSGEPDSQPPTKKMKMDNPTPDSVAKLVPVIANATAVTSTVSMTPVSIAATAASGAANIQGGISLTISNGVINLKTSTAGPQSGSMTSTTSPALAVRPTINSMPSSLAVVKVPNNPNTHVMTAIAQGVTQLRLPGSLTLQQIRPPMSGSYISSQTQGAHVTSGAVPMKPGMVIPMTRPVQNVQVQQKVFSAMQPGQITNTATIQVAAPGSGTGHPRSQQVYAQIPIQTLTRQQLIQSNKITDGTMTIQFPSLQGTNRIIPNINKPQTVSESNQNPVSIVNTETKLKAGDQSKISNANSQSKLTLPQQTSTKAPDTQSGAVVQELKYSVPFLQMTISPNTSISKVDIKSGQVPQQIVAIAQAPVGKVDGSKSGTLSQPMVVSKPDTVSQSGTPDSGAVLTSQTTQSLVTNVNTPLTQVITGTIPANQLPLTKIESKTASGTQPVSYKAETKTVPVAQVAVNKVENGPTAATQVADSKNSLSTQSTVSSTKTFTPSQPIVSKADGKSLTTPQPSNTLTIAAGELSEATQVTVHNNSANVKSMTEPSVANVHEAVSLPAQQGSADSRPKQQDSVIPAAMLAPKKPQWNMVGQLTSASKKPDKNLQPFKQISNLDQSKAAHGKDASLGATAVSQPTPLSCVSSYFSSSSSTQNSDKDVSENCETEKTETCSKQSSDASASCETQSEKPIMTSGEQVSNKKDSEKSDNSSSESAKNETGASEEKETKTENQSTEGTYEEQSQEKKEREVEQKVNNKGEEPMDTSANVGDGADFDPASAMIWENGIGTLQGSNLKFCMNEFGIMEMVTDNLNCTETLDTSNESENTTALDPADSGTEMKVKDEPGEIKEDGEEAGPSQDYESQTKEEEKNEDEISQCENCGEYGFTTDFYKNGRFCSQSCVGAFASKRMRGVKKHGVMSKVVLGLQKRRKKLFLKGGEDADFDIKKDGIPGKKSKVFIWSKYLEKENAVGASPKLFKDPFPNNKNGFKVGMKLEAIDHKHQNLYCVVSIAEVCGYRLRLHFDGYSDCYDFWTNADSPFIFPVGFCEKAQKTLQPPKGFTVEGFDWNNYLKLAKAVAAPKYAFVSQPSQCVTPNAFRFMSKLEAVDKKNSSLICVATVADTLLDKILIHFDSWEESYDYWCDISSPYIHPTGWCQENGKLLSPPCDWKDVDSFTWEAFLNKTKSTAVPARAFKPRTPIPFECGMKVEVVDKRNNLLIRVATIVDVKDYLVKIHFDGWSDGYDYWLDDDSPDLHPPGWCAKTGHPLAPPILPSDLVVCPGQSGCPTPGCKGVGHIKGAKYTGHHSAFGCPYSQLNMNKENALQDRLGTFRFDDTTPEPSPTTPKSNRQLDFPASPEVKKCPVQGCDGSGHVTGKFTAHHKISGCPLAAERAFSQKIKVPYTNGDSVPPPPRPKSTRGRKPRSYYLNMGDRMPKPKEKEQKDNNSLHHGIHQSVFQSSSISLPQRDLPLCWEQHAKLLPGVDKIRGNDVATWTIDQVANFVKTLLGCEEQAKAFREEQIDGEAFLLLTQTDIVKIMNIRLGPALKIYNSILMFKNSMEV